MKLALNLNDIQANKVFELRGILSDDVNALIPDWKVVHFLMARQYDVAKAALMVNAWAAWCVAPIIPSSELTPRDMERVCLEDDPNEPIFRENSFHSFQGEDFDGRPIFWEKMGLGKLCFFSQFQKIIVH
jgi:hypothetical protein